MKEDVQSKVVIRKMAKVDNDSSDEFV